MLTEKALQMAKEPARPLSPHLFIYKEQITMVMSIVHRITGGALYLGTLLLVWWLAAAATGGGALDLVHTVMGHWFGQLVLFGFTWALFHHMGGGLRHFIWDTGHGFSERARFGLAWFTLGFGLVAAFLVWLFAVWI